MGLFNEVDGDGNQGKGDYSIIASRVATLGACGMATSFMPLLFYISKKVHLKVNVALEQFSWGKL